MTDGSRPPARHVDRPESRPDPIEAALSPPGQRSSVRGMRCRVRWIALLFVMLGWFAVGASPAEARDSPARKLGRGFANLGLGVLTLTAPYPFPPEFKPILSPEFPWQRFDSKSRREPLEQRPPPRVR